MYRRLLFGSGGKFRCRILHGQLPQTRRYQLYLFSRRRPPAILAGITYRSSRSNVIQNKTIVFINLPQWGLKPQPPYHHSNALSSELFGQKISEVSFVSYTTSYFFTLFRFKLFHKILSSLPAEMCQ